MIAEIPSWTYSTDAGLTQCYGNVRFAGEFIVGQWFCLRADTGEVVWERKLDPPNTIVDVAQGVIVASETWSRGAITGTTGAWGLSLETGEVLWEALEDPAHMGFFLRLLTRIGIARLGENAVKVKNGEVLCESGAVLDVLSGEVIDRREPPHSWDTEPGENPDWDLYRSTMIVREDGSEYLVVNPMVTSKHPHYSTPQNFYSFRYRAPYLYYILKEGDWYEPKKDPTDADVPKDALFHVVTTDVRTEEIVQDFVIPGAPAKEYRIEDATEKHVLISADIRHLSLFEIRK